MTFTGSTIGPFYKIKKDLFSISNYVNSHGSRNIWTRAIVKKYNLFLTFNFIDSYPEFFKIEYSEHKMAHKQRTNSSVSVYILDYLDSDLFGIL